MNFYEILWILKNMKNLRIFTNLILNLTNYWTITIIDDVNIHSIDFVNIHYLFTTYRPIRYKLITQIIYTLFILLFMLSMTNNLLNLNITSKFYRCQQWPQEIVNSWPVKVFFPCRPRLPAYAAKHYCRTRR